MSDNVIRPVQFSLAARMARSVGADDVEASAAEIWATVEYWNKQIDQQRGAFEDVLQQRTQP
jgi:hypothetical protein